MINDKYGEYVTAKIVKFEGGYRVSIGDFKMDDRVEALELRNMARKVGIKDAWILTSEKKKKD